MRNFPTEPTLSQQRKLIYISITHQENIYINIEKQVKKL